MTLPLHAIKSLVKRCLPHRRKRTGDYVPTRRYQLALTNMASLEKHVWLRGKRSSLLLIGAGGFVLCGLVWMLIFVYTPMRNLLPTRLQSDLRRDYVDLSMRIDSANEASRINMMYVEDVLSIINDERPALVEERRVKLATPLPLDSLMETTHAERSFSQRFENAERFNVSVLSPIAAEGMTFYAPVSVLEITEQVTESGIPYVYAQPAKSSPVSSVYRGTVVNSSYSTGKGVTIAVQHPNDFISIYSGLADVFVSRGDKVEAGQRIGVLRDGYYPFTFELWHNGAPLSPKDYIMF